MIKEFFAKLMSSNERPRLDMKKSNTAEEIIRRERELAREREEMNKLNMRADRVIPRIEMDGPTDRPENHDQPAA